MAIKLPLVVGADGRPQQLQAGDVLASASMATPRFVPASSTFMLADNEQRLIFLPISVDPTSTIVVPATATIVQVP